MLICHKFYKKTLNSIPFNTLTTNGAFQLIPITKTKILKTSIICQPQPQMTMEMNLLPQYKPIIILSMEFNSILKKLTSNGKYLLTTLQMLFLIVNIMLISLFKNADKITNNSYLKNQQTLWSFIILHLYIQKAVLLNKFTSLKISLIVKSINKKSKISIPKKKNQT